MKTINTFMLSVILSAVSTNYAWSQDTSAKLRIEKAGMTSIMLSAADLLNMPRVEYRTKEKDGQEAVYSGVALTNLLSRVDAPLGAKLQGKALAQYLLVEATDGYRVVFALPELDSAFTKQVIFLADRRNGQALSSGQGSYRIVVPNEQKQARWVRQVTALRVLSINE